MAMVMEVKIPYSLSMPASASVPAAASAKIEELFTDTNPVTLNNPPVSMGYVGSKDEDIDQVQLGENDLTLIFEHTSFNTTDLLNFRLVSQSWRDAATTILHQRNALHVVLRGESFPGLDTDPSSDEDESDGDESCPRLYLNRMRNRHAVYQNKNKKLLSQLSHLMSNSKKFPASQLSIIQGEDTYHFTCKQLQPFLLNHGYVIKTLRLNGFFTAKQLNMYCDYAPNLNCLELESAKMCYDSDYDYDEEADHDLLITNSTQISCFPIQTLRVISPPSPTETEEFKLFSDLLSEVLSFSPRLKSVQDVDITTLGQLLQNRQGHLIKELNLRDKNIRDENLLSVLIQYTTSASASSSTLNSLNLDVSCEGEISDYAQSRTGLNSLLESCGDSLQYFHITYEPYNYRTKLDIPRMPSLKFMELTGLYANKDSNDDDMDVVNDYVFRRTLNSASPSFTLFGKRKLLKAYFPNLHKVKINRAGKYDCSGKLLRLFNPEDDVIDTVKHFEIFDCVWPTLTEAKLICKIFPNIRFVKIKIETDEAFEENCNSLWEMCPLAEYIEINEVSVDSKNAENNIAHIDQFFTGFPLEMCKKLRSVDIPLNLMNNPAIMKFLQVKPSICDLPQLKQLKIRFKSLEGQFASHVSCIHAFKKIPNTKVVLCLPYELRSNENAEKYLESVLPYVKIAYSL